MFIYFYLLPSCRRVFDLLLCFVCFSIQTERFDYLRLLARVKKRVQLAQQRAIYSANDEMLRMYWDVGHILSDAQKQIGWGNGALKRLSADMRNDYPEIKGFSVRNCQLRN